VDRQPELAEGVRVARQQEVADRLKTVEGQVRAVRRMVTEGEDCLAIATQAAALEGLRGAMKIVLRHYMDDCLDIGDGPGEREAAYDKFVTVIERFIR